MPMPDGCSGFHLSLLLKAMEQNGSVIPWFKYHFSHKLSSANQVTKPLGLRFLMLSIREASVVYLTGSKGKC